MFLFELRGYVFLKPQLPHVIHSFLVLYMDCLLLVHIQRVNSKLRCSEKRNDQLKLS